MCTTDNEMKCTETNCTEMPMGSSTRAVQHTGKMGTRDDTRHRSEDYMVPSQAGLASNCHHDYSTRYRAKGGNIKISHQVGRTFKVNAPLAPSNSRLVVVPCCRQQCRHHSTTARKMFQPSQSDGPHRKPAAQPSARSRIYKQHEARRRQLHRQS